MRVKVQTKATEMNIGRQASRRFERRAKLLKNATVQEYVDRIAQNVGRNSDVQVPIMINIVDSNEINAISFPGGFLYINSGLILAVDDFASRLFCQQSDPSKILRECRFRGSRRSGCTLLFWNSSTA